MVNLTVEEYDFCHLNIKNKVSLTIFQPKVSCIGFNSKVTSRRNAPDVLLSVF